MGLSPVAVTKKLLLRKSDVDAQNFNLGPKLCVAFLCIILDLKGIIML